MFWQDDEKKQEFEVPDDVVDLLFNIQCRELPVNHAHELSSALQDALPWLTEDDRVGVHNVHLAGSQNGWERPDPELGQRLILSRRTKLIIRAPKERVEQIQQELKDISLNVGGCEMIVGKAKTRPLSKQGTIFSRHIVLEEGEEKDENIFLQRIVDDLAERGIQVKKALCGMTTEIPTPGGAVATRSIMFADLTPRDSVQLQQEGIGRLRHLGCGIFLPHKGIDAVKKAGDD